MGPFDRFERQEVVGALKSFGTSDKDILYTAKSQLLKLAGTSKIFGVGLMVVGALLTITIVGAIAGIPCIVGGWLLRRRGVHNCETVELVYKEYVAGLGAGAPVV